MTQKTCFVIIGYGKKPDFSTGRIIDLDKTYEYIIKPVFDDLGFLCFRASDINHSGVIDVPMYDSILKSDFVIADISTLNPNVLYELGIRHAVRKNTTIIIAEKELTQPFDLSHILINHYEHLGNAIDYGEVQRFRGMLSTKVKALLNDPAIDSPLYTLFPRLEVPKFSEEEVEEIKNNINEVGSLSDLLNTAEKAKNIKDYTTAIKILEEAIKLHQENDLVIQRLALVTYKAGIPTKLEALYKAEEILHPLNPDRSTDLETLGLSGAIHKRLFEELNDIRHLEKSLWFYEKGFFIANDYYNGINAAYLFDVYSVLEQNKSLALAFHGNAIRIRRKVIDLCNEIRQSKGWNEREDRYWVCLTLAEAYFGIGDTATEQIFTEEAISLQEGSFAINSYLEQKEKLSQISKVFNERYSDKSE